MWNWFDLGIAILTYVYASMKLHMVRTVEEPEDYPKYLDYLLSLLNIMIWIRLFSYLRIFKTTRNFIRLIMEISIDMIPFAIVLLIGICGFTVSYDILVTTDIKSNISILQAFTHVFRIGFGDFSTDEYDWPIWTMFFGASIFLSLIMFNMLIAIMSDTFERISSMSTIQDGKEINLIVLDWERLMFWKRSNEFEPFLHWALYI
jgi:hypothetical protein